MLRTRVMVSLIVLLLLAAGFGTVLWMRFGEKIKAGEFSKDLISLLGKAAPTSALVDSVVWADQLLQKYPYKIGSFSGVLPAKDRGEVWLIGRKINSLVDGNIGLENKGGRFFVKPDSSTIYSVQAGDRFIEAKTRIISPIDIWIDDPIAIRATFINNIIEAREVRLLRERRSF